MMSSKEIALRTYIVAVCFMFVGIFLDPRIFWVVLALGAAACGIYTMYPLVTMPPRRKLPNQVRDLHVVVKLRQEPR